MRAGRRIRAPGAQAGGGVIWRLIVTRARVRCACADKILSKMGEGTFGRVLECWDRKHKSYCAIKVVRNIKKYRDAAMIEVPPPPPPSEALSLRSHHGRVVTRTCACRGMHRTGLADVQSSRSAIYCQLRTG